MHTPPSLSSRTTAAAAASAATSAAACALSQAGHGLCCAIGQQLLAVRSRSVGWLEACPLATLRLLLHACRAQPALGAALATDERLQMALWCLSGAPTACGRTNAEGVESDGSGIAGGLRSDSGGDRSRSGGDEVATLGISAEDGLAPLLALLLLGHLLSHGSQQQGRVGEGGGSAVLCALPHVKSLAASLRPSIYPLAAPAHIPRLVPSGGVDRSAQDSGMAALVASASGACLAELLRTESSATHALSALQADDDGSGSLHRAVSWLDLLGHPAIAASAGDTLRRAEGGSFGHVYTRAADGLAALMQRLLVCLHRKHAHLAPLQRNGFWRAIASTLHTVSSQSHQVASSARAALGPANANKPASDNDGEGGACCVASEGGGSSGGGGGGGPLLSATATLTLVRAAHEALSKLAESSALKLQQSKLLEALLALLDGPRRGGGLSPIAEIRASPTARGGGAGAAAVLLNAVSLALYVPFGSRGERSAQALVQLQQAMYTGELLGALLQSMPLVEPHEPEVAVGLMSRLVLGSTHFAQQYVALGGFTPTVLRRMLGTTRTPATLTDALLIICQIARLGDAVGGKGGGGRSGGAGRGSGGRGGGLQLDVHGAVLCERLPVLLQHSDGGVRAKSCNLVGNICKHTPEFYDALLAAGLLALLASRCADLDTAVRKFACFAIGNAGFHSAQLYPHLACSIPPLLACLADADPKTRENAAGALGNLARNGLQLAAELCTYRAPSALLDLARQLCDDHGSADRDLTAPDLPTAAAKVAGPNATAGVVERVPDAVIAGSTASSFSHVKPPGAAVGEQQAVGFDAASRLRPCRTALYSLGTLALVRELD